ncbi:DUF5522 domain-containing protein [Persicobacter psychrovividus]|uniref:Uncharacterized protein n=1 Tax=Persicobacter psychrovividus TaxID=387638 RepID=A0ABM7VLA9_9BACT|nr:hypothetical protein PEPS_40660 [Persicobacter psychrovividus]
MQSPGIKKVKLNLNELIEGVDFYKDERGRTVFTRAFHLKRGHCCKPRRANKCKECPYKE